MENQYNRIDLIGRGAFAKVYKAEVIERFRMEGRPWKVALKYIDAKFQGEILSESIFLKKSKSQYIVDCYDTFLSNDGESIIMVLELCKGTLKEEVKKLKGDLPRIMKLFVQCLRGLKYIHKKKHIHRDIKPENILIDFTGNAKIADFNVMKNIEQTLARTQKGTPLYMAPEVAYGENYSEKVDIWSLCATFYYVLKSHGPFYTHNVKSSVELMIRKKNIQNYEKLNERYCPNKPFMNVLNYNLCNPDAKRMSADDILQLLEKEITLLSEVPSEEDKMTVFGMTQGTNFMDETLESQEIDISKLNMGIEDILTPKKIEDSEILAGNSEDYATNAVSEFEETDKKFRQNLSLSAQIDKKYDALEAEENIVRNESYYDQLNFIKAKKIEDTLKGSEIIKIPEKSKKFDKSQTVQKSPFVHENQWASMMNDRSTEPKNEGVDPSIYRKEQIRRQESASPEIGVLVISDDSINPEEENEFGNDENYSIDEEFEDCPLSDEDEIKIDINYEEHIKQRNKAKQEKEMMFDSMMAPRPAALLPDKKEKGSLVPPSDDQMLMASFLSKTGENETKVDFEYTRSMMTPQTPIKKNENLSKEKKFRRNLDSNSGNKRGQMRNNLINTDDNVNLEENIKKLENFQKKNNQKNLKFGNYQAPEKQEEEEIDEFNDFEQYDEDFEVYDDFDDFDENDVSKTQKTTFQGDEVNETSQSLYETQFGKTTIEKTQNFLGGNNITPKTQQKVLQKFDFIN